MTSAYLDKMSFIIMGIGRHAPRYEAMAAMYPRSQRLQTHIQEYLIVVVHMCHHMFNFSKKSTLGRLGVVVTDPKPNAYQTELEMWVLKSGKKADCKWPSN